MVASEAGIGDQRVRCAGRHDGPTIEDGDAIAQAVNLVHVVTDQQDGDTVCAQILDQVPHGASRVRVESGGELVEQDDPRGTDQGENHRQPLLLAAGQTLVTHPAVLVQAHRAHECVSIGRSTIERGEQIDQFGNGEGGVKVVRLQLYPQNGAHSIAVGEGIESQNSHGTRTRSTKARNGFDQGRLTRTVAPEHAVRLAFGDREVHACHSGVPPIPLRDVSNVDRCHPMLLSRWSRSRR